MHIFTKTFTSLQKTQLLFVCGVSQLAIAQQYLLASPCLQRNGLPVVMRWNASSAAEVFNSVLDSRPTQLWVVWVHQDVHLPEGWDTHFCQAITKAEAQLGALAVVGVYGVSGYGDSAQHVGHVLDRGTELYGNAPLPCLIDSLDELLFAVRTDCGLRLDPALGFDFYATDLVLQAQAAGLQCAVVDAYCEHWSSTPSQGEVPDSLVQRIAASAQVFEHKWATHLPITTPCFDIAQPGDTLAFLEAVRRLPSPTPKS